MSKTTIFSVIVWTFALTCWISYLIWHFFFIARGWKNFKKLEKKLESKIKKAKIETLNLAFENIILFTERIKWAEEQLQTWQEIRDSKEFNWANANYKKEVFILMIKLNKFIEDYKEAREESKKSFESILRETVKPTLEINEVYE